MTSHTTARRRAHARPPRCTTCLDTGAVLIKGTTVRVGCPADHQRPLSLAALLVAVLDSTAGRFSSCVVLTIIGAAVLAVLA